MVFILYIHTIILYNKYVYYVLYKKYYNNNDYNKNYIKLLYMYR